MILDICLSLLCALVTFLAWSDAEEWWQYLIAIIGTVLSAIMFVLSFV